MIRPPMSAPTAPTQLYPYAPPGLKSRETSSRRGRITSRILLISRARRAEGARRHAEAAAEERAERAETLEPALEADFGDAAVCPAEQVARPLKAVAGQVAVRGFVEHLREGAVEVVGREARLSGHVAQQDRLTQRREDVVSSAQQTPVEFQSGGRAQRREPPDGRPHLQMPPHHPVGDRVEVRLQRRTRR